MSSASFASIELEFTPPWPLLSLLIAWLIGLVVAIGQLEWSITARVFLGLAALSMGGRGCGHLPAAWRAVPFIEPFGRPTESGAWSIEVDVRGNRGSLAPPAAGVASPSWCGTTG